MSKEPEKVINTIKRSDVESFSRIRHDVGGVNLLDKYQSISSQSAIYPGAHTPLGLMYTALKLNGEAGEFAEHVGKAMRDDNFGMGIEYNEYGQIGGSYVNLTSERKLALVKELGDILWYVSAASRELGYTLSEVAISNLYKLCDRGERGQLQGSGDQR